MRFLSGLLLGVIIGVVGSVYFASIGGGDYMLATSPRVLRLEDDLRRAAQEREQLIQKLEEASQLAERMADRFSDLERRFDTLETSIHAATPQDMREEKSDETVASSPHLPDPADTSQHEHSDPATGTAQATSPDLSLVDEPSEVTEMSSSSSESAMSPSGELEEPAASLVQESQQKETHEESE